MRFTHLFLMTITIHGCGTFVAGMSSPSPVSKDSLAYKTGMIKNCTLLPAYTSIIAEVKEHIGTAKLLKLEMKIGNDDIPDISGITPDRMYKPLSWVRTTSRHGKGLLHLRPEFDVLSFHTLGLGVENLDVHIKQHPANCLTKLTRSETELLIRVLVMNDFQNASEAVVSTGTSHSACNIHIVDRDGTAVFGYYCCYRGENKDVLCEYLEKDVWLEVLFAVITILKIYVVLFSPKFVPEKFYKEKHDPQPFIYKITSKRLPALKTIVTRSPEKYRNYKNKVKLSIFEKMPCFKTKIQNMELDILYPYSLKKIHLYINTDRLLNESFVPVGIFHTLYESFVQCKIRDKSSVKQCCYSNLCPTSNCGKNYSWYVLLKRFMSFVLLFLLYSPWLVRIYFYYKHEDMEMQERKQTANAMHLNLQYPGSFTLLLTPVHTLFIFIYVVLSFESIVFKVIQTRYEDEIKSNIRSCLRHMFEKNIKEVLAWAVRLILKPCALCGVLGVLLLPFWCILVSPVLLIVLSFYLFPTINITFRFFAQFFIHLLPQNICSPGGLCNPISALWKKFSAYLEMEAMLLDEKVQTHTSILKSLVARFQHLVIILMCIISLYSVLFLITEFLSFIVEIIIYTMIGVVLNAAMVLTYVSLFLLLWFYANDCFGVVAKKFLSFNATMNSVIFGLCKADLDEIIFTPEDKQDNNAFTVFTEQNTEARPAELVTGTDGKLRWKIQRLLLFLNKKDEPLIPKRFYFNTCKMNFFAVPGDVLSNYWRAAREFAVIIVFLLFVLIIVLAFGETYQISSTNKLLATIAGGFVPLVLRKVVFKAYTAPEIDTNAITFRVSLTDEIESYVQTWPIFDIDVSDPETIGSNAEEVAHDDGPESFDHIDSGENEGTEETDPTVLPMMNLSTGNIHDIEVDLLIDASAGDFDDKSRVTIEENVV